MPERILSPSSPVSFPIRPSSVILEQLDFRAKAREEQPFTVIPQHLRLEGGGVNVGREMGIERKSGEGHQRGRNYLQFVLVNKTT